MNPALLIVDPQNDFFESDNPNLVEFQRVLPTINAVIALFKKRGWLIVFVQHTSSKKQPGTHAWKIFEGFNSIASLDDRHTSFVLNISRNVSLDEFLAMPK